MTDVDFSACNITVIDDEPFIRKVLVKILGDIGVRNILLAENGQEGLEVIFGADAKTDLIICDLEMPKMDGFEFVSRLRANEDPNIAATPVLILTGHIDQENVEKAVNLGIHGYLKKPIKKDALEQRMIRALTTPAIDASRLRR